MVFALKYFFLLTLLLIVSQFLCVSSDATEEEISFAGIFDKHNAVAMLIDPGSGRILKANQAAGRFYGYETDRLRQMSIQDINQLSAEQVNAERQLAKAQQRNFFVFRHQLANGDIRTVEVHSSPIIWQGRTVLLSIIHDISEDRAQQDELWHYKHRLEEMVDQNRKELSEAYDLQQTLMTIVVIVLSTSLGLVTVLYVGRNKVLQKLQASEQRLQEVITATKVGTWERNIQTGQTIYDDRWAKIVGCTLEDLAEMDGDAWDVLVHPDDARISQRRIDDVLSGRSNYYDSEARIRHRDGHWVWVLDRGRVVEWSKDGKPIRMSGTHTDITRLKAAEEKARRLAMTDHLTGLSNRAHFTESLDEAIAEVLDQKTGFALLVIDLDRFKPVNDTYGHPVGDAVLRNVAAALVQATGEKDVVARTGGDEFSVILKSSTDRTRVLRCAQDIVDAVAKPMMVKGYEIRVGISIGIAFFPENADGKSLSEALIRNADEAMYDAKRRGRDCQTIDEVMARRAS